MTRDSDMAVRRVFDSYDCAKPVFFAPVPMPGGDSNFNFEKCSDCLLRAHPLVEDGVPDLTAFDSTKASKYGYLSFVPPPERCSLQPSAQAAEIVRRLPSSTCVGFAPSFLLNIEESNVVISDLLVHTVGRDTRSVGSEDVSLHHIFSEFAGTN